MHMPRRLTMSQTIVTMTMFMRVKCMSMCTCYRFKYAQLATPNAQCTYTSMCLHAEQQQCRMISVHIHVYTRLEYLLQYRRKNTHAHVLVYRHNDKSVWPYAPIKTNKRTCICMHIRTTLVRQRHNLLWWSVCSIICVCTSAHIYICVQVKACLWTCISLRLHTPAQNQKRIHDHF